MWCGRAGRDGLAHRNVFLGVNDDALLLVHAVTGIATNYSDVAALGLVLV